MNKRIQRKIAVILLFGMLFAQLPSKSGQADTSQGGAIPASETTSAPTEKADGYGLANPVDEGSVTTWDTVYFGRYLQNDTNRDGIIDDNDEKEPIRWRVLSVDGDDAFLLAEQGLDCQPYHAEYADVTWKTCSLRSWLNHDFYDAAFSGEEQAAIITTEVRNNNKGSYHDEDGENNTRDNVYVLSIEEMGEKAYGFPGWATCSRKRWITNTNYARQNGAAASTKEGQEGTGWWWLRSISVYDSKRAACSEYEGYADITGVMVNYAYGAVRPALHLKLSSVSLWRQGDKVSIDQNLAAVPTGTPTAKPVESATPKPVESATPESNVYGIANPVIKDGVTTWDTICFGNYLQRDTNGDGRINEKDEKEPVRWRVLSVDGDDAFLLAEKNLDCQPYHSSYIDIAWEECSLRSWLNQDFYNAAFSKEEQEAIRTTTVNQGMGGGRNTKDNVYLLSLEEVTDEAYGFCPDLKEFSETRQAKNTNYARQRGAKSSISTKYEGNSWWWLRSMASERNRGTYVCCDGLGFSRGNSVSHEYAVRPAIHLDLSNISLWQKDEKITGSVMAKKSVRTPEPNGHGISNPVARDGVMTWDTVYFGSYWQNDTNGDGVADEKDEKEPIRWRVLSAEGEDVFLLAEKNLDYQPYYNRSGATTPISQINWGTSTLRGWMNNEFFMDAFSSREQSAIQTTEVINDYNFRYDTDCGDKTKDKVYLLSMGEASEKAYGFEAEWESRTRSARNTEYANQRGEFSSESDKGKKIGNYWLRTMGEYNGEVTNVNGRDGVIDSFGASLRSDRQAVRPVLHLKLSDVSLWEKGGKVSAELKEEAPSEATPVPNEHGLSNPVIKDGVTTWDTVYFGNYWQNDTNKDGIADKADEKEPIRWRVLSVNGDDAFLLADQRVERQPYNVQEGGVTWETCTLRRWLNSEFMTSAFSAEEQEAIRETEVANVDNSQYDTDGGNDTVDKIYLLSAHEAKNTAYGFYSKFEEKTETRQAKNTNYVSSGEYGEWWLRTPGESGGNPLKIQENGCGDMYGGNGRYSIGVRPVLHLNLSHVSLWQRGEKVSAELHERELPPPDTHGLSNPVKKDKVTTWDTVYFGNYWQNDTNGDGVANTEDAKDPIRWRVLSVDGEGAFLMADQCLDCQPYNEQKENATWETCTLRTWLNSEFITNAFSGQEQEIIRETNVANPDNPWYDTDGGADTSDKIYLLSVAEAKEDDYGFYTWFEEKTETRQAKNTEYVKHITNEEYGIWWLRSLGASGKNAITVNGDGWGNAYGTYNHYSYNVVRPVLHVNFSNVSLWQKGEQVSSFAEGVSVDTPSPVPTATPTEVPTSEPTVAPTEEPTEEPTLAPTQEPTMMPTEEPTMIPTQEPTIAPTEEPTITPTIAPTQEPTMVPTEEPTLVPTQEPTMMPTEEPTIAPTQEPTIAPTQEPTMVPTQEPMIVPTVMPTEAPTSEPTVAPTEESTIEPTMTPTQEPTIAPTQEPTITPTQEPTMEPTQEPTMIPTQEPTIAPTQEPTEIPTQEPTIAPTQEPTIVPTEEPTMIPTQKPTQKPTMIPTVEPTQEPTMAPTPLPNTNLLPGESKVPIQGEEIIPLLSGVKISSKEGKVFLSWKQRNAATGYQIFRSGTKSGGFRLLKVLTKNPWKFVDKAVKNAHRYYYKIMPLSNGLKEVDIDSLRSYSIRVKGFVAPKVAARKGQVDNIKYIAIKLKKYKGTYVEVYVSYRSKKFKKLKLTSNRIAKYKGVLKLRYAMKGEKIKLKVRTYVKRKGKKEFSAFSKVKTVKV